jgi:hypothetical protein
MYQIHGVDLHPNDVDFFTSFEIESSDAMDSFLESFNASCKGYRLVATFQPCSDQMRYKCGVRDVWNFKLWKKTVDESEVEILPPMQLVSLSDTNRRTDNPNNFCSKVLERFDINICCCAISNPFDLEDVFATRKMITHITNYVMEYNLERFRNTADTNRRLRKYQDRGFILQSICLTGRNRIEVTDSIMWINPTRPPQNT